MDNLIYSIFFFIIIPMLLMIGFTEKKQKATVFFITVGITTCLVASELNTFILKATDTDYFYYTVTFSPMVEELLKTIPLIYTVFFFVEKPIKEKLVTWGFAIGVGFAIFENIIIFFQNGASESVLWGISRGIGASLVHGLCTGAVGMGLCFIKDFKKPYFFGIFSLVSFAAIYHGMYNSMVQSEELIKYGFALPITTYILLYVIYRKYKSDKNREITQEK